MELGETLNPRIGRGRYCVVLKNRLDAIARSLGISSALVPANQNDVDRLHAFRLLAHAEIEEFVEAIAKKAVDVSRAKSAAGILTHTAHHLLVSLQVRRIRDATVIARLPDFSSAHALATLTRFPSEINDAFASHENVIRTNHGLKRANVKRMFIPIGYRDDFFDIGLFDKLDDFGESRGTVAHSTGLVGTASWPTGSVEIGKVMGLMPGLSKMETCLARVLLPV